MTASRDDDDLSRKRTCYAAGVSSSTGDYLTRKKRKGRQSSKKYADFDEIGISANTSKLGAFQKHKGALCKTAEDPRKEVVGSETGTVTSLPSQMIELDGLRLPATGANEHREENHEQTAVRLEKMRGAVRTLLECIGEDVDREGLLNTPLRYAEALLFFTKGYQINIPDIVNDALFSEGHGEMIIVKDIDISSLCEHHLVPFIGKIHIGYISSGTVIGLSKLARIAEIFSRRLQIQERLTKEVAHAIMEILKPEGVAVLMEATHLCMVMRGVEKASATTSTRCMLGCFESRSKMRNEFFSLVNMNR